VAPPKTPKRIVDKINADINEVLRQPEMRARLVDFSAEPAGGTPDDTAKYMREEIERWGTVIKTAGVKLE
jgi:tripartite-type tricarboxylate transporter receptor subunit TctC